jgi:hypothetical protein
MPRISQAEQMLMGALNDLERDWQIAGAEWHDDARKNFEVDFIDEIMPAGRIACGSISELTLLIRRVVRECK